MAVAQDTVYKLEIEDRPGALYEVLATTAEADSNVVFLTAFATGGGKGAAYVITDDPQVLKEFAEKRGLGLEEYHGFLMGGEDRVGVGADVTKPLADAGINVVLSAATVVAGTYQLLIMVNTVDAEAAAQALGV
jgi:hypothetical protein